MSGTVVDDDAHCSTPDRVSTPERDEPAAVVLDTVRQIR